MRKRPHCREAAHVSDAVRESRTTAGLLRLPGKASGVTIQPMKKGERYAEVGVLAG